jgi:Mycobacterium 19 kDa lipoprotein antigen
VLAVRAVVPALWAGSAALLLAAVVSCSAHHGVSEVTSIVFDGDTDTISGPVTCTAQPDGKLVILATDGGQQTVRILLRREHQLIVEKVGLHTSRAIGFNDDPGEMWATKADDTYAIHGAMPPNAGETSRHQFDVQTTCHSEVPIPLHPARTPRRLTATLSVNLE